MSHVVYKDRKNTNSRKWDECKEKFGKENILPLWIADMDFEAPACVKEALWSLGCLVIMNPRLDMKKHSSDGRSLIIIMRRKGNGFVFRQE